MSTLNFGPDWLRALSSSGKDEERGPLSPSSLAVNPVKYKLAEHRYGREEMLGLFAPADLIPPELELFGDLLRERCGQPLAFISPSEEEERCQVGGVNSTLVLKLAGRGANNGRGRGGVRPMRGRGRGDGIGSYNRSMSSDDSSAGRGDPSNRRPPWVDSSNRASYDKGRGEGLSGASPEQRNRLPSDGRPSPSSWRSPNSQEEDTQGGEWQTMTTGQTKQWRRSENSRSWRDTRDNDGVRNKSWNRNNHEWDQSNNWKSPSNNNNGHLPEWCENGDDEGPGTFDSTGQFQSIASQSPVKSGEDVFDSGSMLSPADNDKAATTEEPEPSNNTTSNANETPAEESSINVPASVISKKRPDRKSPPGNVNKRASYSADDVEMSLDFGHVKSIMDGLDSEEEDTSSVNDPSIVYAKKSISYGDAKEKGLDDWLYKDPRGEIQGPFSSDEMMEWFKAGYFNISLLIRRVCDELFLPLGDVVKLWNRVPFSDSGRTPPPITSQTLLQQQQVHQRQRLIEQQHLAEQKRLAEIKQQQQRQQLIVQQQQEQQQLLRLHEKRMHELELQKQQLLQQQMRQDKRHVEQALMRDLKITPTSSHSELHAPNREERLPHTGSTSSASTANTFDTDLSSNRQENKQLATSSQDETKAEEEQFQSQISRKQKKIKKNLAEQDGSQGSDGVTHDAQQRARDEMQLKHQMMLQRHQQMQELEHQRQMQAVHQQQKQQQHRALTQQDTAFSPVNNVKDSWQSNTVTSSSAPSLLEIQRIEERRQLALNKKEQLRAQQQQQQQQADQRSLPGWKPTATTATIHGASSILQIQQEEARRQQLRHQSAKGQPGSGVKQQQVKVASIPNTGGSPSAWHHVTSPSPPAIISSSQGQSKANLFKGDASFWDDVMQPLPETVQGKPSSNKLSQNKSQMKKTKEEEAVERLFKEYKDDSFMMWIEKNMPEVKKSVEVPTFLTFLKDIESAKEVEEYVVSYLGKNETSNLFLNEFLQRQRNQANKQKQQQQHQSMPPISDKTKIEPTLESINQNNKKQSTKKKKKMQKVDPYLLGFSCNSGEDIVNRGGEIMKAEDAWNLKR